MMQQPLAPKRILEWLCVFVGIPFSLMGMISALSGIHTSTIEGFLGTTTLHATFAFGPWVALASVRRSLYYLAPTALLLSGAAGWATNPSIWGLPVTGLVGATIAVGLAVAARIYDDRLPRPSVHPASGEADPPERLSKYPIGSNAALSSLRTDEPRKRLLAPKPILEKICKIVGVLFSFMGVGSAIYGIDTSNIEDFLGTTVLFAIFAFGPWMALYWVRQSAYYVAPVALLLSGATGWAAGGAWGFLLIGLIAAAITVVLAVAARIQDDRAPPTERSGGPRPSGPKPVQL